MLELHLFFNLKNMISNIQTLRAIAALIVVAYHTIGTSAKYNLPTNFFYKVDTWGAAGVDIFFIISGFIMIYIQHRKRRNPIEFIKDRIERIVPLYWFLTLSLALLLIVFPQGFNERQFDFDFLLSSLFFTNFLSNVEPLIYVGWTLEYEMLFYLVFGLSLFIKDEKLSMLACAVCLGALVFLGLNSIIVEFIYGMIIGFIFNNYKIKVSNIASIIMIILGFGLLTIDWDGDLSRSITWGLPSILIFLGFLYSKPFKNAILETLGSASYSIYLVQVFSIPIFYKLLSKLSFLQFPYSAEIYVVLCIIFSAISGIFLYLIIEKPAAYLIKKLKQKKV